MKSSNASWIIGGLIFFILIVGSVVWYEMTPGRYDSFAKCLKDNGAVFYGAFWCPHCQAQKAMFGKSVDKLPYVECSTPDGSAQNEICNQKGVKNYPTWFFANGSSKSGVLSFDELSQITKCPLPQ